MAGDNSPPSAPSNYAESPVNSVPFDAASELATALHQLSERARQREQLDRLDATGLTFGELGSELERLAEVLSKSLRGGGYQLGILEERRVQLGEKTRLLQIPSLLDGAVLRVLGARLTALAEPGLPATLHSYRRGHSPWAVLRALGDFVRAHRSSRPTLQRGLFVLQRDVASYGESLQTGPDSPLFRELPAVLARAASRDEAARLRSLFEASLRQPVRFLDGSIGPLKTGVATGSPVQPFCANLYLLDLDRELSQLGGFYSRFGDDMLFCHEDSAVVSHAGERIASLVAARGLKLNPAKTRDWYFNGAARPHAAHPERRATSTIEYLGARLDFQGCLGLKQRRLSELERALRQRLSRTAALLGPATRDERLALLLAVTRQALTPHGALALRGAQQLGHIVNDHNQLKDLDYRVARMIAELVTGVLGPRAFRTLPYRELRRLGLPSLVQERCRIAPLLAAKAGIAPDSP